MGLTESDSEWSHMFSSLDAHSKLKLSSLKMLSTALLLLSQHSDRQRNNLSFLWRHDAGCQNSYQRRSKNKSAPAVCGGLLDVCQFGFRAGASTLRVHNQNLPRTELFLTNTQGLNMSKLPLTQLHPCYWMDCHNQCWWFMTKITCVR